MTVERWETSRLTRRDLLKRAGVLGVTLGSGPSLLAACGGGGGGGGGIGGTINFLTWQGYDLQGDKDFAKWEDDNGVKFNEAMYPFAQNPLLPPVERMGTRVSIECARCGDRNMVTWAGPMAEARWVWRAEEEAAPVPDAFADAFREVPE